MERIDFFEMKHIMHVQMMNAIEALMEKMGKDEVDMTEREGYILISPDGAESTREEKVSKLFYTDGRLYATLQNKDYEGEKISLDSCVWVMTGALEWVYDELYTIYEQMR